MKIQKGKTNDEYGKRFENEFDDYICKLGGTSSSLSEEGSADRIVTLEGYTFIAELKALQRDQRFVPGQVVCNNDDKRLKELIDKSSSQLRNALATVARQDLATIVIVRAEIFRSRTLVNAFHGDSIFEYRYHPSTGIEIVGKTHRWDKGFVTPGGKAVRRHVGALMTISHLTNGVGIAFHNYTATTPFPPHVIKAVAPRVKQYAWPLLPLGNTGDVSADGTIEIVGDKTDGLMPWYVPEIWAREANAYA